MAIQQRARATEFTMKGSSARHSGTLTQRPPQSRSSRRQDTIRVPRTQDGYALANILGWLSVGLGLAQIVAPRGVATLIGLNDDRGVMRYLGAREVTAGLGILSQHNRPAWLWSRVAGDLMDLAMLAAAFKARNARRDRLAGATAAVLGVTLLDIMAAQRSGSGSSPGSLRSGAVRSKKAITVGCSPEELYTFWRNFENLPRFMNHLESVRRIDDRRSHWTALGPAGRRFEWDAEITEDRPHEYIAWRSTGKADVHNAGKVRFAKAPGDRGTELHLELAYFPPGGQVGATVAWLMGQAPEQRVQEDLRRLKQLFELGETPTTQGQPSGRKSLLDRFSMVGILERDMR